MNYIERFIERKIKSLAWRYTNLSEEFSYKNVEKSISQYRWIIMDQNDLVIYDTEKDGYSGLNDYPAVFETIELIASEKKKYISNKKIDGKPEVIFTFEPQLRAIFPNQRLEDSCLS